MEVAIDNGVDNRTVAKADEIEVEIPSVEGGQIDSTSNLVLLPAGIGHTKAEKGEEARVDRRIEDQ